MSQASEQLKAVNAALRQVGADVRQELVDHRVSPKLEAELKAKMDAYTQKFAKHLRPPRKDPKIMAALHLGEEGTRWHSITSSRS